jgi:thymidylate synthase
MAEHYDRMNAANRGAFLHLFERTMATGRKISPRGSEVVELLDAQITVYPEFPFQTFKARGYVCEYFKKEMRWKLGASRMDESIKEHAKMWETVQNPDGSFNSNYGQYWFGQQMGLMKVVFELIRDKDSRRAAIPMLRDDHLSPETRDTVCTESITFLIRENRLFCSVHMRSSDQIFGLGTDIPTFSVLMMMVHGLLMDVYPDLKLGTLTVTAASSHIYSRHYKMVERMMEEPPSEYGRIRLPMANTAAEVMKIVAMRGQYELSLVPDRWDLYRFLYTGYYAS